jgi:hypothetical protein
VAQALREGCVVDDRLDVQPHDEDVLEEIELISNLMIAASEAAGPLPQSMIDSILGVPVEQRPA